MTAKRFFITLLIIVGIGIAVFYQRFQQQPVDVLVSEVSIGPVEATVSNTRAGTIKACRRSKLSMPLGGVVDRLLVDEGDRVEQGQLLLELWNRDRQAELAQAQEHFQAVQHDAESACVLAGLKSREAKRIAKLAERSLASEEDVDNTQSAAESQQRLCDAAENQQGVAEARLELQQALLERTQLRAPFAGIVAEINGEVGEYVTPSPPGVATPPAVDLIDYSCLYVTAPIDEVDASELRNGMPARITLDAFRDMEFSGEVIRIAPYVVDLAKQARTVDVDVQLLDFPEQVELLVGYSADITVILNSKPQTLRLPTEVILADNKVWLFSTEDSTLTQQTIETGIGDWTFTEVTNGLAQGDKVVRNPDQPGIAEGVPAVIDDD